METGTKILVVDDNDFIRIAVSKMLSRLGYEVASADSGENGLSIFLKNLFDIVLKEIKRMANRGQDINDGKKSAESRVDFIRLAGIGPELAEFLTEFVEKPDKFHSMPLERRREIENHMDAVIASFGKW